MIKIIITDDHPIIRQGIKQILNETPDVLVVAEAGNYRELMERLDSTQFDLILLDISMPDKSGLEIIKELKKRDEEVKILILSMYPEDQYALHSLQLGASGYLTKSSAPSELIAAIREVAAGRKYITESLAQTLAEDYDNDYDKPLNKKLSKRELEVMKFISSGKTIKEISEKLELNIKTVSTYRSRILKKLHLNSNSELIRYALKIGLVE